MRVVSVSVHVRDCFFPFIFFSVSAGKTEPADICIVKLTTAQSQATAMKWLAENVVGCGIEQVITFGDGELT